MNEQRNIRSRILIVDDNPEIHNDIRQILNPVEDAWELNALFADIAGQQIPAQPQTEIQIDSAFHGDEAIAMVRQARTEKNPYALAYVDIRMPPGLDGLDVINQLQHEDSQLQYVIITAYSDYSWQEISSSLRSADNLLILKKPFEAIEIRQSASALIEKWHLAREHKQAVSALLLQRNMLEEHVRERTAELQRANELLNQEIAERKKAEEKIRQYSGSLEIQVEQRSAELVHQNRFFNAVINSLPYPFIVLDVSTSRIATLNTAAEKLGGLADRIGKCHQHSHGLDRPCSEHGLFCPLAEVCRLEEPIVVEHSYADSAGHEHAVEVHACPVADRQGKVTQVIEYCVDISRRKKMERELIKSRKLEAVAGMAGGIAHDFNNLLMAIAGNIELGLIHLQPEHRSARFLRDAAAVAAEAKKLVHKFLLFSSFHPPERRQADPADLIRKAVFGAKPAAAAPELHLPDGLWLVHADPEQIDQVLRELLRNAAEATARNGARIRISAANMQFSAQDAAGLKNGRYVRITVQDEGCGIRKEDLPNIFDPYFSSKARGTVKGMGLGLTIAAFIVSQHEGRLDAESSLGGGTAVHIDLPAVEEQPVISPAAGSRSEHL